MFYVIELSLFFANALCRWTYVDSLPTNFIILGIVTYCFPCVVETAPQARTKTTWHGGSAFITPQGFNSLHSCCIRWSHVLLFSLFTHHAIIHIQSISSLLKCIEHTPVTPSSLSKVKSERASRSPCKPGYYSSFGVYFSVIFFTLVFEGSLEGLRTSLVSFWCLFGCYLGAILILFRDKGPLRECVFYYS